MSTTSHTIMFLLIVFKDQLIIIVLIRYTKLLMSFHNTTWVSLLIGTNQHLYNRILSAYEQMLMSHNPAVSKHVINL